MIAAHLTGWRAFGTAAAFAAFMTLATLSNGQLSGQVVASQKPQLHVPQWQIAAGGKMKFDAASLKRNTNSSAGDDGLYTNIPLDGTERYTPTGGLLSVRAYGLTEFMEFAYKLSGVQYNLLHQQMPKWANGRGFDLQARAPIRNPTKDQMRLMVQDLLVERFKLAVHWETRQLPVLALEPAKAGKLGPQLRVHSDQPPCGDVTQADSAEVSDRIPGGFPAVCGHILRLQPCPSGHDCWGARNVSVGTLAPSLLSYWNFGRPLMDKTDLAGTHDFFFDYVSGPSAPDESGPTRLEALQQQLGLKLVPETAPVEVLVIDHIEEPSPN